MNKLILLIGLWVIVFVSGCDVYDALYNAPILESGTTLTDSTQEEKPQCLYFYTEGDTIVTNDVQIGFDVWRGEQINKINKIAVLDICPDLLEGGQRECIIGYMNTQYSTSLQYIMVKDEKLFDEQGNIIDCESKCKTNRIRGELIEGYQKIDDIKYDYEEDEICWV